MSQKYIELYKKSKALLEACQELVSNADISKRGATAIPVQPYDFNEVAEAVERLKPLIEEA